MSLVYCVGWKDAVDVKWKLRGLDRASPLSEQALGSFKYRTGPKLSKRYLKQTVAGECGQK